MKIKIFVVLICLIHTFFLNSQQIIKDIKYASVNGIDLSFDLYLPEKVANPNLIIWVHGGAWSGGSKANPPMSLVEKGYAMASVDYRTTTQAKFPAYVHDVKAAIRYLRANAKKYKIKSDKIFLWGSSAGGHIVALVGMTNGNAYLEGAVGENLNTSSSVQGIIDFYGPSNLNTILSQSTPHGVNVRGPALSKMFAKPLNEITAEELKSASPVYYATQDDPPLFICHGDQDIQVPINQSIELFGLYKKTGLKVEIEYAFGAGHGGKEYNDKELINKVDVFLKKIIGK